MNTPSFKINNTPIKAPPKNWEGITISLDFTDNQDVLNVELDKLDFVEDAKDLIIDWYKGGLTGQSPGIFEGIPFEMSMTDIDNNQLDAFDGYLDLSEGVEFRGCDSILTTVKKRQSQDWLSDVAGSFSFASLYGEQIISNSQFLRVPYIINYVPETAEVITILISGYMMVREIITNIKELAELISLAINAATPSVGAGAVIDFGDIIMLALNIILQIAITALLLVAVINLTKALVEQFFPKLRYHLGMKIIDLFNAFCQKLGLTFQSSIVVGKWANTVYLPRKDEIGGEDPNERGYPTNGEVIYRGDGFITEMMRLFNAEYKIKDGVFIFENWTYFANQSSFVIPNTYTDQDKLQLINGTNADEINSNMFITYATDQNDQNTLRNYKGINYQVITEPQQVNNTDLKLMKGLNEVRLNESLGVDKQSLTVVEESLKSVAAIIDKITGIFGGGTNYVAKINNRKGSLLMSSHYVTTPRLIVMQGNKLAKNQRSLIGAKALYDEFYYLKSFVETNGRHNQWLTYEDKPIPFCLKNLLTLVNNNYATTSDNEKAKIESLKWNIRSGQAKINYRVNKLYTKNLKQRFNEGGS